MTPVSTMMTPDRVRNIHAALEAATDRRIVLQELGEALGISPDNAKRAARKWTEDGPTGPVATALEYLAQGLPEVNGVGFALPAYVAGYAVAEVDDEVKASPLVHVVRLRFPRFVAIYGNPPPCFRPSIQWVKIDEVGNGVGLLQMIDSPELFGEPVALGMLADAAGAAIEFLKTQALQGL